MGLQNSFEVLSEVVEQYETRGRDVRHAEVTSGTGDRDTLHASMEVPVSLCGASGDGVHPALTPQAASLTDTGGLSVEFATSDLASLPPAASAVVEASEEAVRVTDDGGLVLTVGLTIDPSREPTESLEGAQTIGDDTSRRDRGAAAGETDSESEERDHSQERAEAEPTASSPSEATDCREAEHIAAARDESVPPYEDHDYLQALYDTCDTFTEMSERIEMSVSSETVRRYMIEAGVHEPTSYETATESTASAQADETESEPDEPASTGSPSTPADPMDSIPDGQLVTDGIGLPEGVQISDVADAVVDSVTVYEVQRHLDLDRQRTQELLEELNLLDLVLRPIADNPEQTVSYEQVAGRIRQCAPSRG